MKVTKAINDIIFIKDGTRIRVEFVDGIPAYFSVDYFNNACARAGLSAQDIVLNPDGYSLKGEFTKRSKGDTWTNDETGETGEYAETSFTANQLRVVLSSSGALNHSIGAQVAMKLAGLSSAAMSHSAPQVVESNEDSGEAAEKEEAKEPVIEIEDEKKK